MLKRLPKDPLARLRNAFSLLDPQRAKEILKEHGGGATDLNNLRPSRYGDVLRAANLENDKTRQRKQAEIDNEENRPDGFDDATSTF